MREKKPSRKQRTVAGERVVKDKFLEQREQFVKQRPIVAMTEKQKQYIAMLNDPKIRLVVCIGNFGVGKSFLSGSIAGDKFVSNEITHIIVARPYVQMGKTAGFRPGTTLEKLYPYVRNVLDPMRKRMGNGVFENALKDGETGHIQVQDLESIRGRSFDERSWLLIEESQLTTPEEMLAIVTRVSDNCKLIVSGDLNQRDNKGESGLKWLMDFIKRHKVEGAGFINFDSSDDIVRGGLVRDIAIGLMKEGKLGNSKERK
jgi:phosphate starvation-inducible PhoH-like protein